ncbi:ADP-L-glycero-D-manno-heptose-6-epimerase [Xanthomonas sacchari]|uniref:ADP-L-glycero-D-manno-heptose-6-epimerase n=1 Tax=Xanthomonas sacchari TaxID=56458 RepID=A0ABT3DSM4_9XANT|nr:NAD-dependent epimerase/dehydratase family protein [Xanthomonas sacchari]MCW0398501.1 ADP-L-glycero-D-manno-heptose-6-epimerase [Xanthomonas sacchari]MCW0419600.1 ADP-L-glycero-D-manno-heptose-6-epimerase [Xanthomonas sacchari]UYK71129.1 GDP-mannose 4,6-dehydratase [Xanthomonas sacchari]
MSAQARERLAEIGLIEWLRIGDEDAVHALLRDMRELGVRRLRTQFSWADWHTAEGERWYAWLMPLLSAHCEVLPCFCYTPPSLGLEPRTASPPRDSKAFADFIDQVVGRFGAGFEWIELWNEPNNLNDWDWHLDHDWQRFAEMIGQAAHWAHQLGKKTLLGGMCPTDPNWLALMAQRGALAHIDAVGVHGFPGTWDFRRRPWAEVLGDVRAVLAAHGLQPQVWLSETGYSTWRHDEIEQVRQLRETLDAPVERLYWYAARDLHGSISHQDGFHEDERHYHFGLRDERGRAKLLYRLWAEQGYDGIQALASLHHEHGANLSRAPRPDLAPAPTVAPRADAHAPIHTLPRSRGQDAVLITGGAGFIGTNLAARLLDSGRRVIVYDNLSRPGVEHNLQWLRRHYPGERLQVEVGDVRDRHLLGDAVAQAAQVFHLAAQVAVTSSLEDPSHDFEVNLRGTFNVLEAIRGARRPPPLLFTSTNKVYGALDDVALEADAQRYQPSDPLLRARGIDERRALDFHSPYGCSKGGADQYVLDYARSFGLQAVVLRMSCIYGPHQCGNEDQGWVAHFLIRALQGQPITVYGDGRQVRDLLFVDDLVEAFLQCQAQMPRLSGRAFNMGGGPANAASLREVLRRIESLVGHRLELAHAAPRVGDQRYYVSDTRAFAAATGWSPRVGAEAGIARLHRWLHTQAGRAAPVSTPQRRIHAA